MKWNLAARVRPVVTGGLLACACLAMAAGVQGPASAESHGDDRDGPAIAAPVSKTPASEALVRLGQALFFDPRLSVDGSTSCASCHQPTLYFSDGRAVSRGVGGGTGARNAPSLLNVSSVETLFWEGRAASLEQQALAPLLNPREMAMPDLDAVVRSVRKDSDYAPLFAAAYGDDRSGAIDIGRIADALAAYERSLDVASSRFDRAQFGGEKGAMTAQEERGQRLFMGAAGCSACHLVGPTDAPLTDNRFHSLTVGLQRIGDRLAPLSLRVARARQQGRTPEELVQSDPDIAALGRFVVTLQPADLGAFRTPSLRNVARTAPYMHDGSVPTLEEAVDDEVYYRSAENGRPLLLTPRERADLVGFLGALTSPADAVLAKAPAAVRAAASASAPGIARR